MFSDKQFWTVQEYLDFELTTEERYEYLNGKVRLQKSSSANRGALVSNLIGLIGAQLRNRDECYIYGTTMRIETPSGLFTHPSLSVVCGEGLYRPEEDNATLLNPTLLVEACDFQTELGDIQKKYMRYRSIPSLQEFFQPAHDRLDVILYSRTSQDHWTVAQFTEPNAVIALPSIDCTLTLTDVYAKVTLP